MVQNIKFMLIICTISVSFLYPKKLPGNYKLVHMLLNKDCNRNMFKLDALCSQHIRNTTGIAYDANKQTNN